MCTMARRGMPEVRFGSDVYLWDRHESVLATLWRTIAWCEPIGLSGWWSVLCCLPLLQLRTTFDVPIRPPWRHFERKHLRKKTKNRVGLARHASTTATLKQGWREG